MTYRFEHSTFDSIALKRPTYILRDGPQSLEAVTAEASRRIAAGDFLVAKLAADDVSGSRELLRAGLRKVCVQARLRLDVVTDRPPSDADARQRVDLSDELIFAHAANFRFDRLSFDPSVTDDERIAFYAAWITNSIDGRMGVVVEGTGFLSYKMAAPKVTIDLLSVLDAGRGTASRMLHELARRAADSGCTTIEVVTEAENSPAIAVYQKAGYCIERYNAVFQGGAPNTVD
jgi:ribosomal protein S18 acetylase RimI-like enzyme